MSEEAMDELDEAALAELREDLGEAFQGFVERFLAGAGEGLDRVELDLESGDVADAAGRAHALKGTAGYLGATALTALLGGLQRACESSDRDAARALAVRARQALSRVSSRLGAG